MATTDHTVTNWQVIRCLYEGWVELVDGQLLNIRLPERHFQALVLAARTKLLFGRRVRKMDDHLRNAVGNWLLSREFGAWRNPNSNGPYQADNKQLWADFLAATREQSIAEAIARRDTGQTDSSEPFNQPDATGPDEDTEYIPQDTDRRSVVVRQINERRGQPAFRNELLKRFRNRCAVTGCAVRAVLEAAHIRPYRGENDNNPANGLLLRSDVHTLFDLNLLGVEPDELRVEIHPDVAAEYGCFGGVVLDCDADRRPSPAALAWRYGRFRNRLGRPA